MERLSHREDVNSSCADSHSESHGGSTARTYPVQYGVTKTSTGTAAAVLDTALALLGTAVPLNPSTLQATTFLSVKVGSHALTRVRCCVVCCVVCWVSMFGPRLAQATYATARAHDTSLTHPVHDAHDDAHSTGGLSTLPTARSEYQGRDARHEVLGPPSTASTVPGGSMMSQSVAISNLLEQTLGSEYTNSLHASPGQMHTHDSEYTYSPDTSPRQIHNYAYAGVQPSNSHRHNSVFEHMHPHNTSPDMPPLGEHGTDYHYNVAQAHLTDDNNVPEYTYTHPQHTPHTHPLLYSMAHTHTPVHPVHNESPPSSLIDAAHARAVTGAHAAVDDHQGHRRDDAYDRENDDAYSGGDDREYTGYLKPPDNHEDIRTHIRGPSVTSASDVMSVEENGNVHGNAPSNALLDISVHEEVHEVRSNYKLQGPVSAWRWRSHT